MLNFLYVYLAVYNNIFSNAKIILTGLRPTKYRIFHRSQSGKQFNIQVLFFSSTKPSLTLFRKFLASSHL